MIPNEIDPLAPGTKAKANKIEPAQWTWFFERSDGSIIACQAVEAWQHIQKKNIHERDFKMIGASDGRTFQEKVRESQTSFAQTKDLEKSQEILREGERLEIEKARGNIIMPPDPTIVGDAKSVEYMKNGR